MECNKDEAIRAKQMSEKKLLEKDFIGAKKFAQKAEKLSPELEGVSQLLLVLDVYISSEIKINGESDWYGILNVGPTVDDETIRKSYRKLALSLHPDKNKSFGAEGAFKLVSEAFMLLSDNIKRKIYDQKRNLRNMFDPIPKPQKVNTFWTSCPCCLMNFEYSKVYVNQKIICMNCNKPFWALERAGPPVKATKNLFPQMQNQNANSSSVNHVNFQKIPTVNIPTVNNNISGPFKSRYEARAAAMRFQASNSNSGGEKVNIFGKKRRVVDQSSLVNGSNKYAKVLSGSEKVNFFPKVNVFPKVKVDNSTRELTQGEIRNMLMKKARTEIHKKMDEWNAEKAALKIEITKKESEITNCGKSTKSKKFVEETTDVKTSLKDTMDEIDSDATINEAKLMSVPDPDFHDFDKERTENSFHENQVWAAYDEDDGMPRYYAMIHNLISKKPFKMEISWLNSKSNAELGPINWIASGFPKTSGDYRTRKHEITTSLNSFSHKVDWVKVKRKKGVIQIYPKKGDVWAVYKNWSPDWNEFTPDEVIHKYDMVVVIEDYSEEKGVKVANLVKLAGFKSIFYQNADVAGFKTIPKEEMFRLSHQIPFYLLTGEENVNIPKGCLELDPAALPLELLQTTVEPKDKEIITYFRKKGKKCESSGTNKVNEETTGGGVRN